MADFDQRLPGNVPGEFFVDAKCIDCDACGRATDRFPAGAGRSIDQFLAVLK